jgi:hypothetical protein
MTTMKTSSVSFSQLRRLLLDLGFAETRGDCFWRFEHAGAGTVFLFRPYAAGEHITVQDIASTRKHLDWRGHLAAAAFDDSLAKAPA